MKVTSWSLSGPPRTLTLSTFRVTKRGTGNPLVVLSLPARTPPAASASTSGATIAARAHPAISLLRRVVIGIGPVLLQNVRHARGTPARFVGAQPSGREI